MNLKNNLLDKIAETISFNEFDCNLVVYIIWFADYTIHINELWSYLSEDEKQKASEYYRTKLTKKYIISRGILRCLLSCYTQKHPAELKFVYNKFGKPSLKRHELHFNLSHSELLTCYAISLDHRVGIDLESHDRNLDTRELASIVFTTSEQEAFNKIHDVKARTRLFYDLWTKKEAIIKAEGQGLSLPINTIEVINLLPGNKISINHEQEWYYFPLNIDDNYSGAVMVNKNISPLVVKLKY